MIIKMYPYIGLGDVRLAVRLCRFVLVIWGLLYAQVFLQILPCI